jgi:hypothetical protein
MRPLRSSVYTSIASRSDWQTERSGSSTPGKASTSSRGAGVDQLLTNPGAGHRPQFHLHMNRQAMVWNNSGDRVYLRNADGTFVTQPFPVP